MEIVATNVFASQLPERRPTGTPDARAIMYELLTHDKTHHPHCCIRQYLPLVMVPPALNSWYRVHLHPWGEDDGHIMMELIGNDPMITLNIQIGVP